MILINGENGIGLGGLYGDSMKYFIIAFLLNISVTMKASPAEVHLRRIKFEYTGSDRLLVTGITNKFELPSPLFELGEPRTNLSEKIAALEKIDTVVSATIEEVIPIAITGLQDRYLNGYSSPLYWYRIKCEVRDIVKGDFPASSLEFVATHDGNRPAWQFVRGYAFYFGLKESEEGWGVERFFRSSPLPPYRMEDHIDYFKMRRENPDFDWSQSDVLIKQTEQEIGRWCRDASLEKGKYLIMTFDGDKLWGNLNIDYGKSVTIITNEWEFPLPDNYTP